MESSEYKHVVLSVIFLKFVSDKFEERRAELKAYYIMANPPFNMKDRMGSRVERVSFTWERERVVGR